MVATVTAILLCSCLHHERTKRARRRCAAPWARSTATWQCRPLGFHKKVDTQRSALGQETPGGVGGVVGVGGTSHSEHGVSVQARVYVQLIGWQNTWEQAPGVPATPFSALMAGVNPGRVPVHTALKKTDPSTSSTGTSTTLSESQRQLRRLPSFLRCQDHPSTCRCRHVNPCPRTAPVRTQML